MPSGCEIAAAFAEGHVATIADLIYAEFVCGRTLSKARSQAW